MKMMEINKMFTEKVNEYIAKGYVINPATMAGSQGEVGKVDLLKGNHLVRVWLNHESNYERCDTSCTYYAMVLRVSEWTHEYKENDRRTVWQTELATLESIVFYEVGSSWYVSDVEEARAYHAKMMSRISMDKIFPKTNRKKMEGNALYIARDYLKRKYGYKRVSLDKIEVTRTQYSYGEVAYIIKYNGRGYRLA